MARMYAKVVGLVVLLTGVVGLFAGNADLLGLFNIDVVEDIIHLASGGLLMYVGFAGSDGSVRSVVGILGVVYLLVGLIGFVLPELFGLLPNTLDLPDQLLHLALGAVALIAVSSDKKAPATA